MTQAHLKELMQLQGSTISYLVNDLRRQHLVKNSTKSIETVKVGKPGQLIELDNEYAYFLGIYLEETFFDAHVIGLADKEIYSERFTLVDLPPAELLKKISQIIKNLLNRYYNIKGIGIAIKSVVDVKGNISSFKRIMPGIEGAKVWSIEGFSALIRKEIGDLCLIVENDANCAATYCKTSNKNNYDTSMTFIVNKDPFGVGCGMILNGKLFRGGNGAAGELFFPDRSIQNLVEQQNNKLTPFEIMKLLKDSITQGIYMIDPQVVYLSGSLFSHLPDSSRQEILNLFKGVPYSIQLLVEDQYSLPAKGVVLLTADAYIADLLSHIDRR